MNLAHPAWLAALLLVPLLVIGGILAARARAHRWSRFVAPRLRQRLLRRTSPVPRWISLLSLLAAFSSLVAALSRPQGEGGSRTETVRGRNILLAIDVSRSMSTPDVLPSRLDQAKALVHELLDKWPEDRVGVLAFAGNPFLMAPLTVDHAAVRETVSQLDCDTIPAGGSDLASAVRAAIEAFGANARGRNALVILSDGEEHSGEIDAAALEADRAGLFIITIGIGTADGAFIPDPREPDNRFRDRDGNPVLSRLTSEPLRSLAAETGGHYVHAESAGNVAALVASASGSLDRFEITTRRHNVVIEFFQWLVLPAILLLITSILAATNWRLPAATTVLATVVLTAPARAADPPPEISRLTGGEKAARLHLAEGTAASRAGQLRHARGALSQALLAKDPAVQAAAHHNLGNTLLESGWRQLSNGEAYPGDPDAETKLKDLATAKLAQWLASQPDPGAGTAPREFESIIVAWTDAVRHYDSALRADPSRDDSRHNRGVATRLLDTLRKTLDQQSESLEQQIPEPQPNEQPGETQPQPGEQPQPQPGDQPGTPPDQTPEPREGQPKDNPDETQPESPGGPESNQQSPQPGQAKQEREPSRDDETPAERARRLLKENSDMEQAPRIRNRRHEFVRPARDW